MLSHLRIQLGADFLAAWWQKCENVFWKQNILLCILFELQMMVLHFDIILLVLFLMMIFVTDWQNLCLRTGDLGRNLTLVSNLSQKWKIRLKNTSERSYSISLTFYMPLFLPFHFTQTNTKTYIMHWFDGQSMCQMSSQIHHSYVRFLVKCCAVVTYFHPLITFLHHPNSGFSITISLW